MKELADALTAFVRGKAPSTTVANPLGEPAPAEQQIPMASSPSAQTVAIAEPRVASRPPWLWIAVGSAGVLLLVVGGVIWANLPPPPRRGGGTIQDRFAQFDRNGDGLLAPNELPFHIIQRADRNSDDRLDHAELHAAFEQLQEGLFAAPSEAERQRLPPPPGPGHGGPKRRPGPFSGRPP
jgi:hypothetical protein